MEYEQTPLEPGWQEHDGSGVPEAVEKLPADARIVTYRLDGEVSEHGARYFQSLAGLWRFSFEQMAPRNILAYRILDRVAAQGSQESGAQGEQTSARAPVAAAPTEWMPAPLPEQRKPRADRFAGYIVTITGPAARSEPQGALQRRKQREH